MNQNALSQSDCSIYKIINQSNNLIFCMLRPIQILKSDWYFLGGFGR